MVKTAAADRRPSPAAIINQPALLPGLSLYLQAYLDLSGDRGFNGKIPWTAKHQWAHIHGITATTEFDRFVALLNAMDVAYLEFQKAKEASDANKAASETSKGRRRGNV